MFYIMPKRYFYSFQDLMRPSSPPENNRSEVVLEVSAVTLPTWALTI